MDTSLTGERWHHFWCFRFRIQVFVAFWVGTFSKLNILINFCAHNREIDTRVEDAKLSISSKYDKIPELSLEDWKFSATKFWGENPTGFIFPQFFFWHVNIH